MDTIFEKNLLRRLENAEIFSKFLLKSAHFFGNLGGTVQFLNPKRFFLLGFLFFKNIFMKKAMDMQTLVTFAKTK